MRAGATVENTPAHTLACAVGIRPAFKDFIGRDGVVVAFGLDPRFIVVPAFEARPLELVAKQGETEFFGTLAPVAVVHAVGAVGEFRPWAGYADFGDFIVSGPFAVDVDGAVNDFRPEEEPVAFRRRIHHERAHAAFRDRIGGNDMNGGGEGGEAPPLQLLGEAAHTFADLIGGVAVLHGRLDDLLRHAVGVVAAMEPDHGGLAALGHGHAGHTLESSAGQNARIAIFSVVYPSKAILRAGFRYAATALAGIVVGKQVIVFLAGEAKGEPGGGFLAVTREHVGERVAGHNGIFKEVGHHGREAADGSKGHEQIAARAGHAEAARIEEGLGECLIVDKFSRRHL